MKTYSYVTMVVDGNETAKLDIFRQNNVFSIYEYDICVQSAGYLPTIKFINDWKEKKDALKSFLESTGSVVEFKQNIGVGEV